MNDAIEIQLKELNNHLIKIIEHPAYATDAEFTKASNDIFEKSMFLFQMTERVMLLNNACNHSQNDDEIVI